MNEVNKVRGKPLVKFCPNNSTRNSTFVRKIPSSCPKNFNSGFPLGLKCCSNCEENERSWGVEKRSLIICLRFESVILEKVKNFKNI